MHFNSSYFARQQMHTICNTRCSQRASRAKLDRIARPIGTPIAPSKTQVFVRLPLNYNNTKNHSRKIRLLNETMSRTTAFSQNKTECIQGTDYRQPTSNHLKNLKQTTFLNPFRAPRALLLP